MTAMTVFMWVMILTFFVFGGFAVAGKHINGHIMTQNCRIAVGVSALISLLFLIGMYIFGSSDAFEQINEQLSSWLALI